MSPALGNYGASKDEKLFGMMCTAYSLYLFVHWVIKHPVRYPSLYVDTFRFMLYPVFFFYKFVMFKNLYFILIQFKMEILSGLTLFRDSYLF